MATTTYPSLEAYRAAKIGTPIGKSEVDPFSHLYDRLGFWVTGGIQDYDPKPLPEIVEVKSKVDAKRLAQRGGRPLEDAAPELVAMFAEFYLNKTDIPKPVAALLAAARPRSK